MTEKVLYKSEGRLMRGSGGLFLVRTDPDGGPLSGRSLKFRARGGLRSGGLIAGDRVTVSFTEASFGPDGPADDSAGLPEGVIESVSERKNSLIRPPMANLDRLFLVCAS